MKKFQSSRIAPSVFPNRKTQLNWERVRNRVAISLLFFVVVSVAYPASGYLEIVNDSSKTLTDLQITVTTGDGTTAVSSLTLAPGESSSSLVTWSGDAYTSSTWNANVFAHNSTLVGNSYVGDLGGTELVSVGNATVTDGFTSAEDPAILHITDSTTDIKQPNDDAKKTLWLVPDTTLTPDVYREGVDKIVQAVGNSPTSSGSGGDTSVLDNIFAVLNPGDLAGPRAEYIGAVPGAATDFQNSVYGTGDGKIDLSGIPVTGLDVPSVDGSWAIIPDMNILNHTFTFRPFQFFTGMITGMGYMRLMWLVGFMIGFAWFTQRKFEQYSTIWWQTVQYSTKVEPAQVIIPGVGWAKQLAGALVVSASYVVAVSLFVATVNGLLGGAVAGGGLQLFNMPTVVKDQVNAVMSGVGDAFGVVDKGFPIAAAFEYLVLHYLMAWTMPAQWALVLYVQKFFQP